MAQNSQPLHLAEALQQLFAALELPSHQERLPLTAARGRVLAKDVAAGLNLPPFPASAMDGYAIRKQDLARQTTTFEVIGTSKAGHPAELEVGPGQAIRIFTGAKVPLGANQILLQEDASSADLTSVTFPGVDPAESYIRPVGHDVSEGTQLASSQQVLDAFAIGTLAAAGIDQVDVFKKPHVGVFSSGDELVDPGIAPNALKEGQIYDSNRVTVLQLLADLPCELVDLGRLPDDEAEVSQAIAQACVNCDVLLTSGGVSVGDADFITKTIASLGTLEFWRLNLKPGKPMAFGRINDCFIFGLPGNPVSTIVTLLMVAKPAIWHIAGAQVQEPLRVSATLKTPAYHQPGRAEFQRGIYTQSGRLEVAVTADQSSNRLSTFRHANCLIEIPGKEGDLAVGSEVTILPFRGLLA